MSAQQTKQRTRTSAQTRDLEAYRDISDDVIESDFVPYACLLDNDTLATKNGEVLQIIRITGLGFDGKEQGDLRRAIRDAIASCIPDTSYALWLHTLRRRQSLVQHTRFPDRFSGELDASWRTQHPVQASYVNELYITIVKAAQQAELTSIQALTQSLWGPIDRRIRTHFIDRAQQELTRTCDAILKALAPFAPHRLTTVERQGVFYGEHLEFLEKLINLEYRPIAIPRRDLSHVLTSGEITFGTNAMEVRTAENHRRFAAIITIKEYKESSLAGIDKFLEIPCELIVTQCFDFVGADAAQRDYQTQARYLAISGDNELARWMEIDRLTTPNQRTEKAFGEQQTTIFVIAPSVRDLESHVAMVQRALNRLGIVAIREDLRFEEAYWAQLPSNFPFVVRRHSIDTQHLGGFANLQPEPIGNAKGSAWGPPVALFSTLNDRPYFFNFQRGQSAHSIVMGNPKSGHTSCAHFLIAQSRKLNLNIWYLDTRGRAQDMIQAMGGQYVTPGSATLKLNPFSLEPTATNREFLSFWVSTLIDARAASLNTSSLGFFQQLIHALYALPPSQRRLSSLVPIVREQDAMLANTLQAWTAGYALGELFDMPQDQLQLGPLTAFNLSAWKGQESVMIPLVSYLLHRITSALNGQPTLIVLDEGFHLLQTPLFGPRAPAWFDHLSTQNAAAMLLTSDIEGSAIYPYSAALMARAASIFVMQDARPNESYMQMGFAESDLGAIAHMPAHGHHVLLKRGSDNTVLRFSLAALEPALRSTLSGKKTVATQTPEEVLAELMRPRAGAAG